MTTHYLKVQPFYVREKLLQAISQNDDSFGFNSLQEKLNSAESIENLLVRSPKVNEPFDILPEHFVAITPVEGGICPMGGKGSKCHLGAITDKESKQSNQKPIYGQVLGGCGNCRFFMTGPDFILEQLLTCNGIMLKLRALGKEQKTIYSDIDEIEHQNRSLPLEEYSKMHGLERDKELLKSRVDDLDSYLTPLCIEWFNRHEMLMKSYELLLASRDQPCQQLTLLSGSHLTLDDFSLEESETSDFGLVRTVIEQARFVEKQGIPIPEDHSRLLREFINIILFENSPQNVLLRIPDQKDQTIAASVLAGFLSDEFGDEKVQKAIDERIALPLSLSENEKLQTIISKVVNSFERNDSTETLLSEIEIARKNDDLRN